MTKNTRFIPLEIISRHSAAWATAQDNLRGDRNPPRKFLTGFILMICLLAGAAGFFVAWPAFSAPNHIVISEIQIAGATTADEFVELHNPTAADVNLLGWRLSRRTASGNQTNLLTTFPDAVLPAGGFFLISHPTGYTGAVSADAQYSTSESIANNNTVALYSDAGKTIVDLVGIGEAGSFEGATALNPPKNQSIERQTDNTGLIDTDNNANDFVLSTLPSPKNLSSSPPPAPPPESEEEAPPESPPANQPPAPAPGASGGAGGPPPILPNDILINEFVSDPADEDEEWIELINRTNHSIDLAGWVIEDGAEHKTILEGQIAGVGNNNFFIVINPKGHLNNAGDRIILKTATEQIIDQVTYGDWADGNMANNAPVAKDPAATARLIDGLLSGNPAADFGLTLTPTRGQSNIITTAGSTLPAGPTTLRLSELLPNPAGSDASEFIELTNTGGAEANAIGWRLVDASGADYTIAKKDFPSPMILPGGYLVLQRSVTGLALNNTGGETVKLYPPNSQSAIEEVSYHERALENSSWAKINDLWQWTSSVTMGEVNILTLTNRKPIIVLDNPQGGLVNQKLVFSAEDTSDPDNDRLTLTWSFGDGQSATGETAEHAYSKAGRYRVKLTAIDGRGGQDTAEKTIVIEAGQPQVLGVSQAAGNATDWPIRLNEIFPAPATGAEEWIELYNSGEKELLLTGWSMGDASGKIFTAPAEAKIQPRGYWVFNKSQTRLALNNTGDLISLFAPNGEIADETSYPAAHKEASWSRRDNDEWEWTSQPTPSSANIFDTTMSAANGTSTNFSSGQNAQSNPSSLVTAAGIVTAAPGMIGEKILYISEITAAGRPSSLRVDLPTASLKEIIEINDLVQVSGKIRQVQGESRLRLENISDLIIVRKNDQIIEAIPLETADPDNDLGKLVFTSGTIAGKISNGFTLEYASGDSIRVVVPTSLKAKIAYPVGTESMVRGILSHTNAGLRLLLRRAEDITIKSAPLTPEIPPANPPPSLWSSYLAITIVGSLIFAFVMFLIYRPKRPKSSSLIIEGLDEEETV